LTVTIFAQRPTQSIRSLTNLVETIKANAYKVQELRFRTVHWCDKQGLTIPKTRLPKLTWDGGWRREPAFEPLNSLIWVNEHALATLGYYNNEFGLEEHKTTQSFGEAITGWYDMKGETFDAYQGFE